MPGWSKAYGYFAGKFPSRFCRMAASSSAVPCTMPWRWSACLKNGLIEQGKAPVPIDFDGKFTEVISDFKGQYIKDADNIIKEQLKAMGRLVASGTIIHSYPFCWRSNTPLIYRAFDTWFIKVTDIKD